LELHALLLVLLQPVLLQQYSACNESMLMPGHTTADCQPKECWAARLMVNNKLLWLHTLLANREMNFS
jgi:hypothetical protein